MKRDIQGEHVVRPVHRVQTELGDGEAQVRCTVPCPSQNCSVELERCEGCPHLVSFTADARGPTTITCRPPPRPLVLSPGAAYDPLLGSLLEHERVEEVMTHEVVCASEELSAEELARLFSERGVAGVPVVDEEGRPVGVVSRTDLLRPPLSSDDAPMLHPERAHATAAELMTLAPVRVEEGTPVARAAAVMAAEHVHRAVVVSPEGRVVGILTTLDIARWVARRAGYTV